MLISAHSCMVAWAVAFAPGYLGGIAFDTLIWNGVQIVINIIFAIPLFIAMLPTFLKKHEQELWES